MKETHLHYNWIAYQSHPGAIDKPDISSFNTLPKLEVSVPGSLFASLAKPSGIALGITGESVEDYDWWYHTDFSGPDMTEYVYHELCFEQLASISEIWLNGEKIFTHKNMFLPVKLSITGNIKDHNELFICFRSVNHFLKTKRPRPRWKTNLVNNQNLRWLRTSLLGRIPGWTPPTPALGPCGSINLQSWRNIALSSHLVKTSLQGSNGIIDAEVILHGNASSVTLMFGDHPISLKPVDLNSRPENDLAINSSHKDTHLTTMYQGQQTLENPKLWWPATHGTQNLYDCHLIIESELDILKIDLGKRAFKSFLVNVSTNEIQFSVNKQSIFLRGACWTIADITRFYSDEVSLRSILLLAKDAGINMLRVGGTMTYESDTFYQLCDELGILVWQDFMFANMDYPIEDLNFLDSIKTEAEHQVRRLSQFACTAVYCGNSEIQQQAAMMGIERTHWSNVFFEDILPSICSEFHPEAYYFSSTPSGGALPFHIAKGITHFYGVGAYKKELLASGLREVKFTPECLGFSHVPEPQQVDLLFNGNHPSCHSPIWKQGIPRDLGAGWDFEDIRDHYIKENFGIDPIALRSQDTLHYLAISRVVIGELIKQCIGQWRSPHSNCSGALLWQFNDILLGAGWGLIDSLGVPKSSYFYVKQAFQPLVAFLIDTGLDGLEVIIINETSEKKCLNIELKLLACPNSITGSFQQQIELQANEIWRENVDFLIGSFRDPNYVYQFGPQQHDVVSLEVFEQESSSPITQDIYFPNSLRLRKEREADIEINKLMINGEFFLSITSNCFLQAVHLDIPKTTVDENYFHLVPGTTKLVKITLSEEVKDIIKGYLTALNLESPHRIRVNRT